MKCPLCGFEFDETRAFCSRCPLAPKCKIICCPNCKYEFVAESTVVKLVLKLLEKSVKRDK